MNSPWQLFGLNPQTATASEVKSAYARLLKQNRPDVDPAGFRRVHDAYQAALRWVQERDARAGESRRSGDTGTVPKPDLWKPVPFASPAKPVPDANRRDQSLPFSVPANPRPSSFDPSRLAFQPPSYEAALAKVRRLLGGRSIPWRFHFACKSLSREFDTAGISPGRRAAEWLGVFDGNIELIARKMPDQPLTRLVQLDELSLCYEVIHHWDHHSRWGRLERFARALMRVIPALSSPATADLLALLAEKLAVARPMRADAIASRAFSLMGTDGRGDFANKIDPRIWLGGQLLRLSSRRIRRFWTEQLAHDKPRLEGRKRRSRGIVKSTMYASPLDWPAWDSLQMHMDAELQERTRRWVARHYWWVRNIGPTFHLRFLKRAFLGGVLFVLALKVYFFFFFSEHFSR